MSGGRSSNKGARIEYAWVRLLRAVGFRQPYDRLNQRRQNPLVILRISPAIEIAEGTV